MIGLKCYWKIISKTVKIIMSLIRRRLRRGYWANLANVFREVQQLGNTPLYIQELAGNNALI
jgi:hypothetical protein